MNDFNLKKYLSENKLTPNSKILQENLDRVDIGDGEFAKVGDDIQWINKTLNKRRQGKIISITSDGIHVSSEVKGTPTEYLIRAPYEKSEIYVVN